MHRPPYANRRQGRSLRVILPDEEDGIVNTSETRQEPATVAHREDEDEDEEAVTDKQCVIIRPKAIPTHYLLARKATSISTTTTTSSQPDRQQEQPQLDETFFSSCSSATVSIASSAAPDDTVPQAPGTSRLVDDPFCEMDGVVTTVPSLCVQECGYKIVPSLRDTAELVFSMLEDTCKLVESEEKETHKSSRQDPQGDLAPEDDGKEEAETVGRLELQGVTVKLGLSSITLDPDPQAPQDHLSFRHQSHPSNSDDGSVENRAAEERAAVERSRAFSRGRGRGGFRGGRRSSNNAASENEEKETAPAEPTRFSTRFLTNLDECSFDTECRIETLVKQGVLVEKPEARVARLVAQVVRTDPEIGKGGSRAQYRVEMTLDKGAESGDAEAADNGAAPSIGCRVDLYRPQIDLICPRLPLDCRTTLDFSRTPPTSEIVESCAVVAAAYKGWVESKLADRTFEVTLPPSLVKCGTTSLSRTLDYVDLVPKHIRRAEDRVFVHRFAEETDKDKRETQYREAILPHLERLGSFHSSGAFFDADDPTTSSADSSIEFVLSRLNTLELTTRPGGYGLSRRQYKHPLLMREARAVRGYTTELFATSTRLRQLSFAFAALSSPSLMEASRRNRPIDPNLFREAFVDEWLRVQRCVLQLLNREPQLPHQQQQQLQHSTATTSSFTTPVVPSVCALIRKLGHVVDTPLDLRYKDRSNAKLIAALMRPKV